MIEFISQDYIALFVIVSLGLVLGNIKIKAISLDFSAVIFVALLFGHYGILIPEIFQKIGLIIFIFTIAIQAGPGFFESFQKQGRQLAIIAVTIVGSGALIAFLLGNFFHIDSKIMAGLLAGALTSTPGLAAAIEISNSPIASIGYGIAYPFGVIGVIFFVRFIPSILNISIKDVENQLQVQGVQENPKIISEILVMENQNLDGKKFGEIDFLELTGANISRLKKEKHAIVPNSQSIINIGDIVKAVGTRKALDRVRLLIGRKTSVEIPLAKNYIVQWVLVSNKAIVNKTLYELNLRDTFHATVTRIRRSGIDIAPTPDTKIRLGDRLMIACDKEHMDQVIKLLGNDDRRLSETNVLPIFLGITLGILAGQIRIPIGNFTFSPGVTGGILAVGILLSKLGKTGPIIWAVPGPANQLLRQMGLLFFLSAVGTKAGSQLMVTVNEYGVILLLLGALITLIPMIIAVLLGHYIFKINFLTLLGIITGGMTSSPGLAAVTSLTDSNAPCVAYAAVYPFALVSIIIFTKLIVCSN